MHFAFKSLVLSSAALCATAAFAADQARVSVPFGFVSHGASYPAGMYDVILDHNRSYVTLASKEDVKKQITWIVGPAEPAKSTALVTFDQVSAGYELKKIQLGDKATSILDKHSRHDVSATTSISGQ